MSMSGKATLSDIAGAAHLPLKACSQQHEPLLLYSSAAQGAVEANYNQLQT